MRFCLFILMSLFLTSSFAARNEYPTVDTVRFVVNCMADNGGQTEENLYACTCRFDVINAAFTFAEYEEVSVYVRNKAMPGEKGGVFRDLSRNIKDLSAKYAQISKQAASACPIAKRVIRREKAK